MNEILGYFSAIFIGITLGLIGGGGSILTVPVLVYILSIEPILATAYSLFVVGFSALVGTFRNIKKGNIDVEIGVIFAVPSLLAVYFTRRFIVPAIPQEILKIENFTLSKEIGIMLFFALIMFLAGISMIRGKKESPSEKNKKINYPIIIVEGMFVGIFTGLVGAGGGFLIIPALVLLASLPMKKAIATSLMIIAVKSLFGFTGDLSTTLNIDWTFLITFSGFSILGMGLGLYMSKFIEGEKLKKLFGYFILFMAVFVFTKELI